MYGSANGSLPFGFDTGNALMSTTGYNAGFELGLLINPYNGVAVGGRYIQGTNYGMSEANSSTSTIVGEPDTGNPASVTAEQLKAWNDSGVVECWGHRPDMERVFAEAGRTVPDDVAVVSFDDSPIAVSTQPALSSVRQPIEEMGREMTRLLMRAIEGMNGVPRRVILPAELVVRASSGEVTSD